MTRRVFKGTPGAQRRIQELDTDLDNNPTNNIMRSMMFLSFENTNNRFVSTKTYVSHSQIIFMTLLAIYNSLLIFSEILLTFERSFSSHYLQSFIDISTFQPKKLFQFTIASPFPPNTTPHLLL
jgi:predicted transglutaminase-like protease